MKWRVRVNYSLQSDKDPQSDLRNRINSLLKECGLINSGTGRWETTVGGASSDDVAEGLNDILVALSDSGALDHISIEADCGIKQQPAKFELKL